MANKPRWPTTSIALMDALRIEKAIVGGFDWGSRTAVIMAALWPERCKGWWLSAATWLRINANQQPLPPQAELGVVVSVLLRNRAWQAGYPEPVRIQQTDLEERFAKMELRRRYVQPHRGGVPEPGPRRASSCTTTAGG